LRSNGNIAMKVYNNKIAIVTGGASGIGRALCEKLASSGAQVVIADIDANKAGRIASEIMRSGGNAQAVELDVSDETAVYRTVKKISDTFGRLDYFFNNAGICISGDARDIPVARWKRLIDVDLFGVLYGTLAAYDVMVRQGGGHIVNISSIAGFAPFAINTPYTTAKYGVVGLTESFRAEARDLGVKVSLVCPGIVQTEFYESMEVVKASKDEYTARLPSRLISAAAAADIILRRVAKNRSLILFPFHAHVLWWVNKLAPWVTGRINLKMVRKFSEIRQRSSQDILDPIDRIIPD
jgi:NAD(P)-dependent dehydrogenase (short-subunit alcohol dehydrogenase family)